MAPFQLVDKPYFYVVWVFHKFWGCRPLPPPSLLKKA